MINVLFLCLGNICRSPMAEAIFRKMVREAGLAGEIAVDSAGLSDWHEGERPHRGTIAVLNKHGVEHDGLLSRPIRRADIARFDYIVAMDSDNLQGVRELGGTDPARVFRLLDLVPESPTRDVPDPYYTGKFDQTYALIYTGCERLLQRIQREGHEDGTPTGNQ